jgi:hypothetical protein
MTPRMGGFWADPDLPAVQALEVFDPETLTATKAPIFERRVLQPRLPRLGADTAERHSRCASTRPAAPTWTASPPSSASTRPTPGSRWVGWCATTPPAGWSPPPSTCRATCGPSWMTRERPRDATGGTR